MGSWLRNIQGQLSDLANEVLSEANDVLAEATEEVPDPDGEIIVAKKKCAEAEKQLAIESAKVESLSSEKTDLEQQLYDAHVEMDAIGTKLNGMVKQRDEEIKKLKNQMEQIQESGWHEAPISFPSATETTKITELRQQIDHWKSIAEKAQEGTSEEKITVSELDKRIEALRQQKEHEIQAIVESHAESMVEMREMYEEKLSAMQVLPYNASSSTSNADTLDAVLLEKDDVKSTKSTNGSDGESERPVVVDLGSHDELVDERIRQMEQEMDKLRASTQELEDLKAQNRELADAYTELNNEYEEFKEQHDITQNVNTDLTRRIDALKANLIEYEERYELCKKENAETVSQLERLSGEFARLRDGVANVSQRREDCDTMVGEEVEKLRHALEESKAERERLRGDVQKFQVAVGEIDVELEKLRDANRQLLGENQALTENLASVCRYDTTMKDILSSSEEDIGKFREQFQEIQENHKQQREAMVAENDALREETEAIKRQRDTLMEESALLKELNEKLKHKSATEEEKNKLLEHKSDLLQQVLDKERAERQEEREEHKQKTAADEEKLLASSGDVSGTENENAILKLQLKECLIANTEKTEECERLHVEARNLEREVELRQNCVDEMIAQTNTLQVQQESMSLANKNLQNQVLAHERTIVQLEEKLAEQGEKNAELENNVKSLQDVILGSSDDKTEKEEGSEEEKEDVRPLKRYIAELQSKVADLEGELKTVKETKALESSEQEEVRRILQQDLYEAEEVDRGLLEGIEARVKELENALEQKTAAVEDAKKRDEKQAEEIAELSQKVYAKEEQVEKLEEKVHLEEQKVEKLEERLAAEQQRVENSLAKLSELEKSFSEHQVAYDSVISQKTNLQTKFQQSSQITISQVKDLQATIHNLQAENAKLRGNQSSEVQNMQEKLKNVTKQLDKKIAAVEDAKRWDEMQGKKIAELSQELYEEDINMQKLKGELAEEQKRSEETSAQLSELQNSFSELQVAYDSTISQKAHLETEFQQSSQTSSQVEELRATVQALQSENATLRANQSSETSSSDELRSAIEALQQENEHLKGVAKTQYDENVKYYEQFQAMATHNQQIQDQLNANNDANEKRAKELQRLREHLMIVEENSTREAVEAEQRETELRERVKILEAQGHQVQEGATETNQQYQVQIASLTSQVESLQRTSNDWKGKYENEVKARENTQEALASLQNIVRELSIDHERDAATASHRNLELQTQIQSLTEEITQIREEMDRQSIGKQAAEEESERRQLQLDSKQKIIEDLENQIEDLRSPRKQTDSYRIDDSTLRQLFLTYFLSEPSKRPDIALLLANILEYPAEEMEKFKSAVRQSFNQSGSSLFWGGSRSSPGPSGNIADQFIRFLETESESSRTAPHLPLRTQNEPAPRMSMDSSSAPRSPNSKNNQASASSSAAALDSLLR